ncbi:MAG TPA: sigma-70 family RNA polymerase sigma factor [Humisphaera sp.]
MDERTREVARRWALAVPAVSAFLAALLRDAHDRDDVLQETAVAVLESAGRYDPARPFVGWAVAVARNQVLVFLRKRGRARVAFDSAAVDAVARAFGDDAPPDDRRLDRLRDCFAALDPKARDLCRLRYETDLKPAAIGARLGLDPNTVAKALQRVRDRLRDCVDRKAAAEAAP